MHQLHSLFLFFLIDLVRIAFRKTAGAMKIAGIRQIQRELMKNGCFGYLKAD